MMPRKRRHRKPKKDAQPSAGIPRRNDPRTWRPWAMDISNGRLIVRQAADADHAIERFFAEDRREGEDEQILSIQLAS